MWNKSIWTLCPKLQKNIEDKSSIYPKQQTFVELKNIREYDVFLLQKAAEQSWAGNKNSV